MTGEQIPSLIMQTIDELRARGVLVTSRGGAWCVNFRSGAEATAYLTDDLEDAFAQGRIMARAGPGLEAAAAPEASAVRRRRKGWRPRTAKAVRRAFFKKHNQRMRARALREQRTEG